MTNNLKDIDIAVFDLDKTLILQDSLFEQIKALFQLSKQSCFYSFYFLFKHGRVLFKKKIFQYNKELDNSLLSLANIRVNNIVKKEFNIYKENGKKVIIATAAYRKTALKVLERIRLYPELLIATEDKANLKGKLKLEALQPHIQNTKWAYYGDSSSDIPLFKSANFAYKVNGNCIDEINRL